MPGRERVADDEAAADFTNEGEVRAGMTQLYGPDERLGCGR